MSGRFDLSSYVTVDERIDRFWADYPHGAIRTELLYANNDGSSVAIRASVFKDWEHPHPDATGIAQELQGGANANRASWWENCETSAIGRALANMGMSISKQRPSREEMAKVQRYQDERPQERPAPYPDRPAPAANTGQAQHSAPAPAPPAAPVANGQHPDAPANWTTIWREAKAMGIPGRAELAEYVKPELLDDMAEWQILARLREARPASYAG
jgi:hypothetical protein